MRTRLAAVTLLTAFLSSPFVVAMAQEAARQEAPPSSSQAMKGRVFQLAHRSPKTLLPALQPLTSSLNGAVMTASDELRTISVRDLPENLAAIEAAIRLLDKPETQPSRTALEVHVSVIAASQETFEGESPAPQNLLPVVEQLRRTLSFKNYRYVTTLTQRILEWGRASASGAMPNPFPMKGTEGRPGEYHYELRDLRVVTLANGNTVFQIGDFEFSAQHFVMVNPREVNVGVQSPKFEPQRLSLSSGLTVREGEQLVVGSSYAGTGDKAVIIVLSVRRT